MTIGIMQPYFMPYIGYWQLMAAADVYVVYDDVNYIKGGWVARNRILMGGKPYTFTITLNGASPYKLFKEITIRDDFKKFMRTLNCCYAHAPYYKETMALLEDICSYQERSLGVFMRHSFQVILDYLGVKTKLLLSSELKKNSSLKGGEKVKDICRELAADIYLNAIGGQGLYDKSDFQREGIILNFLQTNDYCYDQGSELFVKDLSIIDVLMHNGKEGTQKLLKEYTLV
ncbi:MAG: WbqC family protein [Paludibacteraceae bacterium]|nr:WbqC family protein [Paludibacteraceae bacterium]